jgi:hypothetical protein
VTSALFDSGRSALEGFGTRQEILSTESARYELLAAVLVNMGDLMYSTNHAEEITTRHKIIQNVDRFIPNYTASYPTLL